MLSIIASNSKKSINRQVANELNNNIDLNILNINDEKIPMYSPELEEQGIPDEILRVYHEIKGENKIVIFTPEYNGLTTPYFKNIFDWLSRVEHQFLENKEVVIICTSPGSSAGASVRGNMEASLPYFGATKVSTYGIGDYYTKFENDDLDGDYDNIYEIIS